VTSGFRARPGGIAPRAASTPATARIKAANPFVPNADPHGSHHADRGPSGQRTRPMQCRDPSLWFTSTRQSDALRPWATVQSPTNSHKSSTACRASDRLRVGGGRTYGRPWDGIFGGAIPSRAPMRQFCIG
jgi:hypothetical protein